MLYNEKKHELVFYSILDNKKDFNFLFNSILILFYLSVAIVCLWIGFICGVFSLSTRKFSSKLTLLNVIHIFGIFILGNTLIATLVESYITHYMNTGIGSESTLTVNCISSIVSQVVIFITMLLYVFYFTKTKLLLIFCETTTSVKKLVIDFFYGASVWCVAFPTSNLILIIANQALLGAGLKVNLQSAITVLKDPTLPDHVLYFIIATITIIAPIMEEFMFRGVVQNYFRRKYPRTQSIVVSSFVFALLHYSFDSTYGNIPLLASLFILSCFLGIVYEKRQSLFAPIGLHMLFNTISVLRVTIL